MFRLTLRVQEDIVLAILPSYCSCMCFKILEVARYEKLFHILISCKAVCLFFLFIFSILLLIARVTTLWRSKISDIIYITFIPFEI